MPDKQYEMRVYRRVRTEEEIAAVANMRLIEKRRKAMIRQNNWRERRLSLVPGDRTPISVGAGSHDNNFPEVDESIDFNNDSYENYTNYFVPGNYNYIL